MTVIFRVLNDAANRQIKYFSARRYDDIKYTDEFSPTIISMWCKVHTGSVYPGCLLVPCFKRSPSADSINIFYISDRFLKSNFYGNEYHSTSNIGARTYTRSCKLVHLLPWGTDGREIYGFMTHPLLVNEKQPLRPWKIAAWPLFQPSAFMQLLWPPFKHTTHINNAPAPHLSTQTKVEEWDTHLRGVDKHVSLLSFA